MFFVGLLKTVSSAGRFRKCKCTKSEKMGKFLKFSIIIFLYFVQNLEGDAKMRRICSIMKKIKPSGLTLRDWMGPHSENMEKLRPNLSNKCPLLTRKLFLYQDFGKRVSNVQWNPAIEAPAYSAPIVDYFCVEKCF